MWSLLDVYYLHNTGLMCLTFQAGMTNLFLPQRTVSIQTGQHLSCQIWNEIA